MLNQPKVILIVLDGWGYNPNTEGNAIAYAKKPNYDNLWQNYPHTLLSASGEAVGLPWGEIGSSEVGHLTIGAGRVVYQDLPRVTRAINDGSFFENKTLLDSINHTKQKRSSLHLVGLLSSGGVHSHIVHLEAILKMIKQHHLSRSIYLHIFTDGRDTQPNNAAMFISKIEDFIREYRLDVKIVSICGRYYGMDRDNHWERTLAAYENIVEGKGQAFASNMDPIDHTYKQNLTDEFIQPSVILQHAKPGLISKILGSKNSTKNNIPIGSVQDNDAIIFFNFRPDRMRQMVELFCFPRQDMPNKVSRKNLFLTTLTEYNENLPVHVAFPPQRVTNSLPTILSQHRLLQLHIAETEKYAHVTYFFSGGNPVCNEGEQWHLAQSPAVATYDLKPEMSAIEISNYVISSNRNTPYDFVLINFANADLVGHTGSIEATSKGIEAIDTSLGKLLEAFPQSYFIVTADHGNAEAMKNPQTGGLSTKHSINPVPLIIAHPSLKTNTAKNIPLQPTGILADIAPTVLGIIGIPTPPEMTGYNLLESLSPAYQAATAASESLSGVTTP